MTPILQMRSSERSLSYQEGGRDGLIRVKIMIELIIVKPPNSSHFVASSPVPETVSRTLGMVIVKGLWLLDSKRQEPPEGPLGRGLLGAVANGKKLGPALCLKDRAARPF